MKAIKFTSFISVFLIFLVLGIPNTSKAQTVVQWYTSMGDFRAELREDLVPGIGQNFIDLTNDHFYTDLIFHRVISGFMIQDGCPYGTGTGGPGYSIDDEFHPDLRHNEPGILSMANSGPNTNGSQYFITLAPTAWLDDVHAVFGKIIDGMEVVYAIGDVETNANDKPLIDVVIDSVRVVTGERTLELTAPSSYNSWNYQIENQITWNSSFIADIKIEFSSDYGENWELISESYSALHRKYAWNLPSILSEECFIRISDVANPEISSINEEPFTICNLDLEYPDGFEIFMNDLPVQISWSEDLINDVLTIYYQLEENGDYFLIEEGVPSSDLAYIWYPDFASDWCKIHIEIAQYGVVYDESDFRFFVYSLDLVSPQGGEALEGNTIYQIEWDGEVMPKVKIEFSPDNGSTWELIANNVNFDESPYDWELPNINASDCFIRLSVPNAPELFKQNSSSFSIHKEVGLEELGNRNFSIFPNPVHNFVSVDLKNVSAVSEDITIEVYNSNGQIVFVKDLSNKDLQNNQRTIDTQKLPQGVYFINVKTAEKESSLKFIKM